MFREILQIIAAIHISTTTLPEVKVNLFAKAIQDASVYADVDPLTIVSVITHESQWRERAVSPDGLDYGLMQVRAQYYMHGNHSDWLFNGVANIKAGTYIIKVNK